MLLGFSAITMAYPLNDSVRIPYSSNYSHFFQGCYDPEILLTSSLSKYPSPRAPRLARAGKICDSPKEGYQCFLPNSHLWAQYAPFFNVESEDKDSISNEIPQGCQVDFVQMISRHGARFPTKGKGGKYQTLLKKLKDKATLTGKAAFLKSYEYTLGTESLVPFGEQELVNAGIRFNERYSELSSNNEPFIRSTSSERVMKSAKKFVEGFQNARGRSTTGNNVPTIGTILSNEAGFKNTLNHNTCDKFESTYGQLKHDGMDSYVENMMKPIKTRLAKEAIKEVDLSDTEVLELMELCGFDTVAASDQANKLSPFCTLFTDDEWEDYNYSQSLAKYYAFGNGNPLGAAQGFGFLNELSARLTGDPVKDATSVNHTLAKDPKRFPLGRAIYLDFTHDNGMIPMYSAMGLYNQTLSKTKFQTAADSGGFSLSWVVPFAARSYIERMTCCPEENAPVDEEEEEEDEQTSSKRGDDTSDLSYIRLIVNERVVPLPNCNSDELGRCRQKDFIEKTLALARSNGNWQDCFS